MHYAVICDKAEREGLGAVGWGKFVGAILTKFVLDNAEPIQKTYSAVRLARCQEALAQLFTREQLELIGAAALPDVPGPSRGGYRGGPAKGEGAVRDPDRGPKGSARGSAALTRKIRRELAAITTAASRESFRNLRTRQKRKRPFKSRGVRLQPGDRGFVAKGSPTAVTTGQTTGARVSARRAP